MTCPSLVRHPLYCPHRPGMAACLGCAAEYWRCIVPVSDIENRHRAIIAAHCQKMRAVRVHVHRHHTCNRNRNPLAGLQNCKYRCAQAQPRRMMLLPNCLANIHFFATSSVGLVSQFAKGAPWILDMPEYVLAGPQWITASTLTNIS